MQSPAVSANKAVEFVRLYQVRAKAAKFGIEQTLALLWKASLRLTLIAISPTIWS